MLHFVDNSLRYPSFECHFLPTRIQMLFVEICRLVIAAVATRYQAARCTVSWMIRVERLDDNIWACYTTSAVQQNRITNSEPVSYLGKLLRLLQNNTSTIIQSTSSPFSLTHLIQ